MRPLLDTRRVTAVSGRLARVQVRSMHRWFDTLVWPVVDTVLWGSIGAFVDQQGGAARAGLPYMLSGLLLMHVVYQSNVAVATAFLEETWSRNLLNLMVTPLREVEYLAGVVLFGLAKLGAGIVMVGLAAWGLYAFDITGAGLGLIPPVIVLALVGWAIALVVIGLVLRFGTGVEILTWGLLFIVVALSGAFYPVEALPPVLRELSPLLPSTHAFAAARALLDGRGLPVDEMVAAAVGLAVALPLSAAFLLRMLGVFRRRGYVTRYS